MSMNFKFKNTLFLLSVLTMQAGIIQTKSAVYLVNESATNIVVEAGDPTDSNTELITALAEVEPSKKIMLFKLGRGPGNSIDFTDATISIDIPDIGLITLAKLRQKVDHGFAHSSIYYSLSVGNRGNTANFADYNEISVKTTKPINGNFYTVTARRDVRPGTEHDNIIYTVTSQPAKIESKTQPTDKINKINASETN